MQPDIHFAESFWSPGHCNSTANSFRAAWLLSMPTSLRRKPSGISTPMHVHEREEETIHVIERELTATVDGVKHVLRAGSTILLHRNIAHRLHNSGDQTCRYILLATPAGFADFVAEAAEIWDEKKAGTLTSVEEIQRLLKAAPSYGNRHKGNGCSLMDQKHFFNQVASSPHRLLPSFPCGSGRFFRSRACLAAGTASGGLLLCGQ
jgi:mannose-6-phosphate isomerase-like protein (cupin superfamily)